MREYQAGKVDFDDVSITENTRVAYPLKFIPNARLPAKVWPLYVWICMAL